MITNLNFTHIGKDSELKGDFIFKNSTKISGKITGNIQMLNNSLLTIEIGAQIFGSITGCDIEIYGSLDGEIKSSGNVIIFPTGSVDGKIVSKNIEVLPGANLNITGHTEI